MLYPRDGSHHCQFSLHMQSYAAWRTLHALKPARTTAALPAHRLRSSRGRPVARLSRGVAHVVDLPLCAGGVAKAPVLGLEPLVAPVRQHLPALHAPLRIAQPAGTREGRATTLVVAAEARVLVARMWPCRHRLVRAQHHRTAAATAGEHMLPARMAPKCISTQPSQPACPCASPCRRARPARRAARGLHRRREAQFQARTR